MTNLLEGQHSYSNYYRASDPTQKSFLEHSLCHRSKTGFGGPSGVQSRLLGSGGDAVIFNTQDLRGSMRQSILGQIDTAGGLSGV